MFMWKKLIVLGASFVNTNRLRPRISIDMINISFIYHDNSDLRQIMIIMDCANTAGNEPNQVLLNNDIRMHL